MKLDAEEQKSGIRRIEEMLGEVVKYLESDGYGFVALNLSNVIEQIGKADKCD